MLAKLSLAELSAYFWLNCLNFKSAELSLAELSGRDIYQLKKSLITRDLNFFYSSLLVLQKLKNIAAFETSRKVIEIFTALHQK